MNPLIRATHTPPRARVGLLACAFALASLSCSSSDPAPMAAPHAVVIAEAILVTARQEDPTGGPDIVEGINLDERVDLGSEMEGCFKADGVSPIGDEGIDNQLGDAGGLIAMFGGDVEALIQGAINEGSLLIVLEFEGLDDFVNDDDVTVRFLFGRGPTDVGNDGILVPGQSFDIREEQLLSEITGASIVDGRMQAGVFDTVLPVAILDQRFDLPINGARLDLTFDPENGHVTGILGGGVPTQTLIDDLINNIPGVGDDLRSLAGIFLPQLADLRSDGSATCDQMSAAIRVSGVRAFVLRTDDGI